MNQVPAFLWRHLRVQCNFCLEARHDAVQDGDAGVPKLPHSLIVEARGDERTDGVKIGGVIYYTDLALVRMIAIPDRPGIAAPVFETLGKRGLNVLLVQSVDLNGDTHVVFCVGCSKDLSRTLGLLQPVKERFGGQGLIHNHSVAIVSSFGPDSRGRRSTASMICAAPAKADTNILFLSTSLSSVSCVVDKGYLDDALEASRDTFEFHHRRNIAVQ